MNPRKRRASETLLPLKSKQPRTTSKHPTDGGNPSASQYVGIGSRWIAVSKEAWRLSIDTMFYIFTGGKSANAPTLPLHAPPPRPEPLQAPREFPVPNRARTPPPLPTPSTSASPPRKSNSRTTTETNVTSPPSTVTLSASLNTIPSSSSFLSPHPRLNDAIAATVQRTKIGGSSNGGVQRRVREREHIFAKVHREKVKANQKKDREDMIKELYLLNRNKGYTSDLSTFQGWISYRSRLEILERREFLSPSPSLIDLRSKSQTPAPTRRHSFSEDINTSFLERALQKARETLESPKPPPIFHPTLDQMRLNRKMRDIELENRLRPKRPPLPASLPPSDEAYVDSLFARRGVVGRIAREQVSHTDLSRLRPSQWLNDEIINFYGALLMDRAEKRKGTPTTNGKSKAVVNGTKRKPLDVHYFSTFFWSKLKGEGYEKARLAKWTKKFDIFTKDVILIPVNHNNSHWTAAAINFRKKRIESYDSMGMGREVVYKLLRDYLNLEHLNKKKKPFDFTGWENYTHEDTPQQENGYDCGVFTCQFLESLSCGDESFGFTQKNMPYLRRRMVWEIGKATLREDV